MPGVLTVCPDCKYPLEPAANTCLNCGARAAKPVRMFAGIALFGVIAAVTIGFGQSGPSAGTDASVALLMPAERPVAADRATLFSVPNAAPAGANSPLKAEVLARIRLKDMQWQRDIDSGIMMLTADVTNESWFDVKDVEVTCVQYSGQGRKAFSNWRAVDGVIVKAGGRFSLVSYHMGPVNPGTTGAECHMSDAALVGMWPGWIADNEPNAPETIKEMQRRLAARGFYIGEIDGIIGPQTRAAIEKFEAHQQQSLDPVIANASLSGRLSLD